MIALVFIVCAAALLAVGFAVLVRKGECLTARGIAGHDWDYSVDACRRCERTRQAVVHEWLVPFAAKFGLTPKPDPDGESPAAFRARVFHTLEQLGGYA